MRARRSVATDVCACLGRVSWLSLALFFSPLRCDAMPCLRIFADSLSHTQTHTNSPSPHRSLAMVEGEDGLAKLHKASTAMGIEAGRQKKGQETTSSRERKRLARSQSVVQMVTQAREILAGTSPDVAPRALSGLRKTSKISPKTGVLKRS